MRCSYSKSYSWKPRQRNLRGFLYFLFLWLYFRCRSQNFARNSQELQYKSPTHNLCGIFAFPENAKWPLVTNPRAILCANRWRDSNPCLHRSQRCALSAELQRYARWNLGVTVSMNSWIEDSCGYLTCYSFFCVVIVVKSEAVKVFDLLRSARVTVQKSHA